MVSSLLTGHFPSLLFFVPCPPEPQPLADLLRQDPRPPLLRGGPVGRGHEDLDGRDRHGSGGVHAVPELRRALGQAGGFGGDAPITDSSCFLSSDGSPSCFTFESNIFDLTVYLFPPPLYVILSGFKKGGNVRTHTRLYINQM